LTVDDWKWDIIPEIMDGKNIADFIDPDIELKLQELEREEDDLQNKALLESANMDEESDLDELEAETVDKIRSAKALMKSANLAKKTNNKPRLPGKYRVRSVEEAGNKLQQLGLDIQKFKKSLTTNKRKLSDTTHISIEQSDSTGASLDTNIDIKMDDKVDGKMDTKLDGRGRARHVRSRSVGSGRSRSASRAGVSSRSSSLSRSKTPKPGEGYRDVRQKVSAEKLAKLGQRPANQNSMKGEGDHRVFNLKPKHLFSGKRGIGKSDRR